MIILHNARCSKSREALQHLDQDHCEYSIRNYLEEPLSELELKELVAMLGCRAEDIVRKDEPLFLEKYGSKKLSESACIRLLAKHPELLQRPIVIEGSKAIVGRPPILVLDLAK